MIYLKWKLSDAGVAGTGPEGTIADRGGHAEAGWAVDAQGYRVGYLTTDVDLAGLEVWDVTEVSAADALAFAQAIWADAEINSDGILTSEEPDDPAAE
jgi:hypothetical protein